MTFSSEEHKRRHLKNVCNQTDDKLWTKNRNIFFYVPLKKFTVLGLHKCESIFSFWGTIPLTVCKKEILKRIFCAKNAFVAVCSKMRDPCMVQML
ncbi:Cytochrome f [Labeo rohita]|uniref:Cytochrome f n=1 Tax=Labeo rohita TaxID=84645 RepID=A0ABQ8MFY9_LABRO|nr:Cytochrome f [Labeo rohita]